MKNEESKREQSYLVVETVDDEIDLYELFLIIKRRFKWVILTLLSVVSFAVMYLYFTSPIFLLSHTYRDNLISFNRNFSVYLWLNLLHQRLIPIFRMVIISPWKIISLYERKLSKV